jgi:beta-lactamase class A
MRRVAVGWGWQFSTQPRVPGLDIALTKDFPLCSTFKLLAVGAVLARTDQAKEQLERIVRYTQKDIVTYSPVTEKQVDAGSRSSALPPLL